MKRREFITLLGSAAAWPLAARAQQVAKPWRIGYLAESRRQVDEIFRQSMRKLGYIEGSNLTMIYRWAQGGSFEPLADDLVAQSPDLIVAVGSPATRAVKERTTRIPIVMVGVGDPVAYGFIPSLAHPGGNITGTSMQMSEIGCQSALDWDPLSASKKDPFDRRALLVALAPSKLVGVAETARARVV